MTSILVPPLYNVLIYCICYVLCFYSLLVQEINLDVLDEVKITKNTTLSVTLNALKVVLQHCLQFSLNTKQNDCIKH